MAKDYNDLPLLGDRVKALIEERKTTQVKLAEYMGITSRYLNGLIQGKKGKDGKHVPGMINKDRLIKMSRFLDCSPYYLIDKTVGYIPFSAYEKYDYDFDDCLKGLLNMQNYKPSDFSDEEFKELMQIMSRQIDKYAALHYKQIYNEAFWVPEDGDSFS